MSPTPLDGTPAVVKRTQLVEQLLEALDGVEELAVEEQLTWLGQAQDVLSGVLRGDDVAQLRIPGIG